MSACKFQLKAPLISTVGQEHAHVVAVGSTLTVGNCMVNTSDMVDATTGSLEVRARREAYDDARPLTTPTPLSRRALQMMAVTCRGGEGVILMVIQR
jgi:hypothetical protein